MVFKLVFFEHSVISRKLCRNWSAEVVPLVNMALFVTVHDRDTKLSATKRRERRYRRRCISEVVAGVVF